MWNTLQLSWALGSDNWKLFDEGHKLDVEMVVSLISYLLPNNYVLNGVGLTIRMNEDDCLNTMTSNEFVTSGRSYTLICPSVT